MRLHLTIKNPPGNGRPQEFVFEGVVDMFSAPDSLRIVIHRSEDREFYLERLFTRRAELDQARRLRFTDPSIT